MACRNKTVNPPIAAAKKRSAKTGPSHGFITLPTPAIARAASMFNQKIFSTDFGFIGLRAEGDWKSRGGRVECSRCLKPQNSSRADSFARLLSFSVGSSSAGNKIQPEKTSGQKQGGDERHGVGGCEGRSQCGAGAGSRKRGEQAQPDDLPEGFGVHGRDPVGRDPDGFAPDGRAAAGFAPVKFAPG